MSVEIRTSIAAALSTVLGVTGYPKAPTIFRTGDGWPLWGGSERWDGGGPFVTTWRVVIVLPADEAAADEWIADHLDNLVDALTPVVHIDRIDPALAQVAGNDAFRLTFTCRE